MDNNCVNSVASVCKRTIPIERPPLVSEVGIIIFTLILSSTLTTSNLELDLL
jgi:hypothetical protein